MKHENPPDWLFEGLKESSPGEIVTPAIKRARASVATREVIELCIGNLFSVLLILLAPLFKGFVENALSKRQPDNHP